MNKKTIFKWFVPQKDNHYQPYALRKKALTFYIAIIFGLKATVGFLFFAFPQPTLGAQISIQEIVNLANQARSEVSLAPLKLNAKLNVSAQGKANDMMAKQYFAHVSPEGVEPWFWFDQAGYNYTYAGENLALGFETAEGVHKAWMNSPGHRDNIVNPNYKDIGIAIIYGDYEGSFTTIIVQHFGSTESDAPQEIPAYPAEKETPEEIKPLEKPIIPAPDITAPAPPVILTPSPNALTNKTEITITGQAEAGASVLIYENKEKIGQTIADKNNRFRFNTVSNFSDGVHSLSAMAIDSSNNRSAFSKSLAVTIDTVPPAIDLEQSYILPTYLEPLKNFDVIAYVTGDPSEVKATSGENEVILKTEESHLYRGVIERSESGVWIHARDRAGNIATAKLNAAQNTSATRSRTTATQNDGWNIFLSAIDQISNNLIIIFIAAIAILLLANILINIKKQNSKIIGGSLLVIFASSIILCV